MFERVRFIFFSARMISFFKAAMNAEEAGNKQRVLPLLRKALEVGHAALSVQSPKISEPQRTAVANGLLSIRELYRRELIAQMPEGDRELLISVLKSWADMGLVKIGVHPIDQMINMFEIAKSRLDESREVLGIIYKGDHVPIRLQNIMQPFLSGEVSQEETERRLDGCIANLKQWMSESFPGESLPAC